MIQTVKAVVRFWADFVIGDDWTIAVAICLGLAASWVLARAGAPAWWPLPVAVILVVLVSLRRAIERGG